MKGEAREGGDVEFRLRARGGRRVERGGTGRNESAKAGWADLTILA
jgi:hypothetical protein